MADAKQSNDAANSLSSDPNEAGSKETKAVNQLRPALMTPSDEYDQNAPFVDRCCG